MAFTFNNSESINGYEKIFRDSHEFMVNNSPRVGEFMYELIENMQAVRGMFSTPEHMKTLDNICDLIRDYDGFNINNQITRDFSDDKERLMAYFSVLYGIVSEVQFKLVNSNNRECMSLLDFGNINFDSFSNHAKTLINFSRFTLPTEIVKKMYHSPETKSLLALRDVSFRHIDAVELWESGFQKKKDEVNDLKRDLDTYKSAYNFVGLYKGFESLRASKSDEKLLNQIGITLLMIFIFVGIGIERESLKLLTIKDNPNIIYSALAIVVPSAILLVFLLYLFRILLHNISSAKSQLLQINLRMTLCQFIESYAERAETLSKKHKEGFEKFENIIFSPIVATADKMPSTFEGVDQIANLIKAIRINDATDDKPTRKP